MLLESIMTDLKQIWDFSVVVFHGKVILSQNGRICALSPGTTGWRNSQWKQEKEQQQIPCAKSQASGTESISILFFCFVLFVLYSALFNVEYKHY